MRLRIRKTPGRHWKLMTLGIVALVLGAGLALAERWYLAAAALLVGVLTLAVQWLCIEPPYVSDEDMHGSGSH
jgi:hypothetical protein